MPMPALFTRMSSLPNSSIARFTIAKTSSSFCTFVVVPTARTPSPRSCSTAASVFALFRAAMRTSAPASASPIAMPSPIPPLPPVTTAAFPLRSKDVFAISKPSSGVFRMYRIRHASQCKMRYPEIRSACLEYPSHGQLTKAMLGANLMQIIYIWHGNGGISPSGQI